MVVADQPSVAPAAVPAPIAGRLAAQLLDWLVAFIVVSLFLVAAGLYLLVVSDMARRDPTDQAIVNALLIASLSAPAWCVVTLAGFTWHGRSVGKLAMNLRVVDRHGSPPNIWRSLVRMVVYVLEVAPVTAMAPIMVLAFAWRPSGMLTRVLAVGGVALLIPLVSIALALRGRAHRALHDLAAGTQVVVD